MHVVPDNDNSIRTEFLERCKLCGQQGRMLYEGLNDRLFGASGTWTQKICTNNDCGLVWLDPMPVEEDLGKAYSSYFTHQDISRNNSLALRLYQSAKHGYLALKYDYYRDETSWFSRLMGLAFYCHPGLRADVDFGTFYLDAHNGGRLLEVGCGSGRMLKAMAERGWSAEGVDFDPNAVTNARQKGLTVHLGSLADQHFPDNTFDAIVMSHVIEHVPDPLVLLLECQRILKSGAILISVTPNTSSFGHQVFRSSWLHLDPPRHLYLLNSRIFLKMAKSAGFTEANVLTTIRDANGLMIASRAIRNKTGYRMGQPETVLTRLWGRGMQLVEWFLLKFNRNVGEELVLMARKQASTI